MENDKEAGCNVGCRSSRPNSCSSFIAEISLRMLTFVSTLVSICLGVTSRQQVTLFGIQFVAHYHYVLPFRYFIGGEAVVCGSALISAIAACLIHNNKTQSSSSSLKPRKIHHHMFLCDLIMLALIVSATSSASGVGYIGIKGLKQTSWMPVCNRVPRYCREMMVSVGFAYVACLCLFALTIMSCYTLKSQLCPNPPS